FPFSGLGSKDERRFQVVKENAFAHQSKLPLTVLGSFLDGLFLLRRQFHPRLRFMRLLFQLRQAPQQNGRVRRRSKRLLGEFPAFPRRASARRILTRSRTSVPVRPQAFATFGLPGFSTAPQKYLSSTIDNCGRS